MKFRRKSAVENAHHLDEAGSPAEAEDPRSGPHSWEDVEGDGVERVDLGSLLFPMMPDREIRLQINQATQAVMAVQIVGKEGAVEVRAFAAPRNGDLWSKARADIKTESEKQGATVAEREGRFGIELLGQVGVDTPDGPAMVASRLVGVNGDRWLLRGSFLGQPANEPSAAEAWDDAFASVVVRRGAHALPVGEPLPLTMPVQTTTPAGTEEAAASAASDQPKAD